MRAEKFIRRSSQISYRKRKREKQCRSLREFIANNRNCICFPTCHWSSILGRYCEKERNTNKRRSFTARSCSGGVSQHRSGVHSVALRAEEMLIERITSFVGDELQLTVLDERERRWMAALDLGQGTYFAPITIDVIAAIEGDDASGFFLTGTG